MDLSAPAPKPRAGSPAPRKQSRDARRVQLIEATIETLATRGYARTTLAEVAAQAGLSHGLVNFHFRSKERLLAETMQYLADEYRENWTAALAGAGPEPAAQLDALLRADFHPRIYTPVRLAAWCAFWGEAQARPLYQTECSSNDEDYIRRMEAVVAALLAEGGYAGDPVRIARVLRVTVEGMWLDLTTMRSPYPREEALASVHTCAAAFFPRHFTDRGLIAPPA